MTFTDEQRKAGIEKTKHILQPYLAGEPHFTTAMLKEWVTKMAEYRDYVKSTGDKDGSKKFGTKLRDESPTYDITYRNAQEMVTMSMEGDIFDGLRHVGPTTMVLYDYTEPDMPDLGYPIPSEYLPKMKAGYQARRKAWLDSQTFLLLKAQLDGITFPISINKIVCFGLGTMTHPQEFGKPRSGIQHAAVESLMEILRKRNGEDIRCYAQDPAYFDSDKAFLESIGIETVEDPKGFLEVDGKTLVVTVASNICVRQIVADLQWPGAMLWNTVGSADIEKEKWGKTLSGNWVETDANGGEYEIWGTDPCSPRLRMLVENCVQYKLQDDDDYFGDVTLYVRKPTVDPVASPTPPKSHK